LDKEYRKPHEALIRSIEEGENTVDYFVQNFGFKILNKQDTNRLTSSKNMLEIALQAGNDAAYWTIVNHYEDPQHVVIHNVVSANEKCA